ncbi:MAG: glycosyltransferase family 2 protein [Deltaproteobacteria bacterium]|nr:glycosyltransferase family 2 protein [Deltaproteobacteria bacterium]
MIPAYNEEARLPPTLDSFLSHFRQRGEPFEIIVVSDGSTDGTARVVKERIKSAPELHLIEQSPNQGKGAAVKTGLLAARGDIWLFSDADESTPADDFESLKSALDAGADFVMGSRAIRGAKLEVRQSLPRELLGRCFNLVVRLILWVPFHDTQCGFKAFRARTMRPVIERLQTPHFGFDFEIVHRTQKAGLKIAEVPVRWRDRAGSKVNVLRDGIIMVMSLFRVRRLVARDLRGGT